MRLVSNVTQNTLILTLSNGVRIFAQALSLLLIARILSASEYGAFVTILAVASAIATFSGLGSCVLLVRDTAKQQENFNTSWGVTLASVTYSAPILLGIYFILSPLLTPAEIPLQIYIPIGIAEILLWPLSNICVFAYQGHERMLKSSLMLLLPPILRCIIAIFFLLNFKTSLLISWSYLYMAAAAASAIICQFKIYQDFGKPTWPTVKTLIDRSRESVAFSGSSFAQKIFIDADKIMLSNAVSTTVTGFYSAGYRLVDFAFVPIYAFLNAISPQMFRESEKQTKNVYRIKKLVATTTVISFFCSALLFCISGFIPDIIGATYIESVKVVQYMALLPIISAPRLAIQYYLSSVGCQKLCMKAILIGGLISILLNFMLIFNYGWIGAIVAAYASEICTGILMVFYTIKFIEHKSTTYI